MSSCKQELHVGTGMAYGEAAVCTQRWLLFSTFLIFLHCPQALKEEITRVLNADNPHAPSNIVRFNFKERVFKQISTIDHLSFHFTLDSNLLHNESEEGKKQLAKKEGRDGEMRGSGQQ